MMFLNSAAIMFESTELTDAMGVEVSLGSTQRLNAAAASAGKIQPSSGLGDTLFAMYGTVTNGVLGIIHGIWAGPEMLVNLGVPSFVVAFLFAPAAVIVAVDIAYMITGRSL